MYTEKHFYKNVIFSLRSLLVSLLINDILKHRHICKTFQESSEGVVVSRRSWVKLASSSCLKSGEEGNAEADVKLIIVCEENSTRLSVLHFWDMVMGCARSCAITLSLTLKVSVRKIQERSECWRLAGQEPSLLIFLARLFPDPWSIYLFRVDRENAFRLSTLICCLTPLNKCGKGVKYNLSGKLYL